VLDRGNTGSTVWADTAYRSKANEAWLEKNGYVSDIHHKKPKGRPMSEATSKANGRRSKVSSTIERVFARLKGPMKLFTRTVGIAPARVKIGINQPDLQHDALRLAPGAACPGIIPDASKISQAPVKLTGKNSQRRRHQARSPAPRRSLSPDHPRKAGK
jgi:hypothetical protein